MAESDRVVGRAGGAPSRPHHPSPAPRSEEEYLNDLDPSILRFLIAAREETTSTQLRDDLLSMLVAGHETTASAMTWTLQLLAENREEMAKAQAEIDAVLGDR